MKRYTINHIFSWLLSLKVFRILTPDSWFLYFRFKDHLGYYQNLCHPKTFNEKSQWLKLNDRRPEYIKMVDKHEAKKYVASRIGEEHIIPTLGV